MNVENIRKQENDFQPVDCYSSITDNNMDITMLTGIIAMSKIFLDLFPMMILELFTER